MIYLFETNHYSEFSICYVGKSILSISDRCTMLPIWYLYSIIDIYCWLTVFVWLLCVCVVVSGASSFYLPNGWLNGPISSLQTVKCFHSLQGYNTIFQCFWKMLNIFNARYILLLNIYKYFENQHLLFYVENMFQLLSLFQKVF